LKDAAFALLQFICFLRRYERLKTIRLNRTQRDHGKPSRTQLTNLKPHHACGIPKPLNSGSVADV
jgi:hypothetical protein